MNNPSHLTFAPDGSPWIVDLNQFVDSSRLLRVSTDGRVQRITGGGTGSAREGLEAIEARHRGIGRVHVADNGTVYVPTFQGIWKTAEAHVRLAREVGVADIPADPDVREATMS